METRLLLVLGLCIVGPLVGCGTCGSCPAGASCSSGRCVPGCKPNCQGRSCGDDGCGGICGQCTNPSACNGAARCAGCSLVPQRGCRTGERCALFNGDVTICVGDGTNELGAACAPQTDDCKGGDICIGDGSHAMCRAFCASDSDCTQAPAPPGLNNKPHCLNQLSGSGSKVCTYACSPGAHLDGCPSGFSCRVFTGGTEFTDCTAVGAGGDGAPCTTDSDCNVHLACVRGVSTTSCRAICQVAAQDCAGGRQCLGIVGSDTYGFCCLIGGC